MLFEARQSGSLVPEIRILAAKEDKGGITRNLRLILDNPLDALAHQASASGYNHSRHFSMICGLMFRMFDNTCTDNTDV